MQFKVPQNIDLEDKIFGPLTLLQFIYILVGGMFIYILFISIPNKFIFFIIAIPLGALTFSFAFVKIQDQPFSKFLGSLLTFITRPKARVWHKEGLPPPVVSREQKPAETRKIISTHKKLTPAELDRLAKVLDTEGEPEEAPDIAPTQKGGKVGQT